MINKDKQPPHIHWFYCEECNYRFCAEGEGLEWFYRPGKYIGTEWYIGYCPICGHEIAEYRETYG